MRHRDETERIDPPRRTARRHWLTVRAPAGAEYEEVRALVQKLGLHTVCQSAQCPNIAECWRRRTATFMILGETCTRNCGFCAVSSGVPIPPNPNEPQRVADAVRALDLRYAVITSVTRDDLPDGGASVFAETILAIRRSVPQCGLEVLIPDFQGDEQALLKVVEAGPDVLNHNVETVPRLYSIARPQADYARSLDLLAKAKSLRPTMLTKSGLMLGLGESRGEVIGVMADLRSAGCDALTLGQYLSPSREHLPIARYYTPAEFDALRDEGLAMGFTYIESGPLIRSSYHADRFGTHDEPSG